MSLDSRESRVHYLSNKDVKSLLLKLTLFATNISRGDTPLADTNMPDPFDMAHDSIVAFIDGERIFDPDNCSFYTYLTGSIRSRRNSLFSKTVRRNESNISKLHPIYTDTENPQTKYEIEASRRQLLSELKDFDVLAYNVVGAILYSGVYSEPDLAEFLKITRHKVRKGKEVARYWVLNHLVEIYEWEDSSHIVGKFL